MAVVTGRVAESTLRRRSTNYGGSGGDRRLPTDQVGSQWAEEGYTEGKHRASTRGFPAGRFATKKCQLIIDNFGCGKKRRGGRLEWGRGGLRGHGVGLGGGYCGYLPSVISYPLCGQTTKQTERLYD